MIKAVALMGLQIPGYKVRIANPDQPLCAMLVHIRKSGVCCSRKPLLKYEALPLLRGRQMLYFESLPSVRGRSLFFCGIMPLMRGNPLLFRKSVPPASGEALLPCESVPLARGKEMLGFGIMPFNLQED